MNTYTSYQLITKDIDKSLQRVESEPQVKRETDYYLANITKVKSIDDFLGNDRLYRYAMKAFGLEDMSYAKAFMKKVLTEGVDDSDAFANQLSDKRYAAFAKTFDFNSYGENTTVFTRAQQGVADQYARQTLETEAGDQNEGVRLALYFDRKASSLTSFYDVLADTALSKVMRTVLNLPDSFASSDIDKQVQYFESKFDISDFSDPTKLSKFLTRFTTMYDISNSTATNASGTVSTASVAVLFSQPTEYGISTSTLLSIQKMRG